MTDKEQERLRRWRLVLGGGRADAIKCDLTGTQAGMERALAALYGSPSGSGGKGQPRSAGLGSSSPNVSRWLGDIRTYFPTSVVQVMQQDAMDRLGLHQLLLEPEVLEQVQPDVHLVSTLVSLNRAIPEHTRETARLVVRKVVEDVERRLEQKTREAIVGALDRGARTSRPRRLADVDWHQTIRANLRHYQPELGTIIPDRLIGYARRRQAVKRDILLCVDQSGSMATSVVYASIFAAVLASIRSLRTSLVLFDTAVVDMTEQLADPVDVLFGAQLGGGTDIARALQYTQGLIANPSDSVIVLLALSDDGAPMYDHGNAAYFASLGAPAFACTPDQFPDLIAAAIERRDITTWAAKAGITTSRAA